MNTQRLELLQTIVSGELRGAEVAPDRVEILADPEECLSMLNDAPAWDVVLAVALHLKYSHQFLDDLFARFRDEAPSKLYPIFWSTQADKPPEASDFTRSSIRLDHNDRWSLYFHTRCALAALEADEEPAYAMQMLEPLRDLFPPRTNDSLSWDISFVGRGLFWHPLKGLYERLDRFRDALEMHLVGQLGMRGPSEYELAEKYFDGWLAQLIEGQATVAECRQLADLVYGIIRQCAGIDELARDSLRDCPRATRQFWSWYYGRSVGALVAVHPHLIESLIHEVLAGDWNDGWPAVALLCDADRGWPALRARYIECYEAADIEHLGARPWDARQPAHLSPQSNLYWAMHVGFADAMISAKQGEPTIQLADIKKELEIIRTTTSSHSQRAIRAELATERNLSDIKDSLTTPESARQKVSELLGETFELLPSATIQHLISAVQQSQLGRVNESRVDLAKAVESVFTDLIRPRLVETMSPENAKNLTIVVSRPGGQTGKYLLDKWDFVSPGQWADVLEELSDSSGPNESFARGLMQCFPAADQEKLGQLAPELRDFWQARGSAAHHSERESYPRAQEQADLQWSVTFGQDGSRGLLSHFCEAVGHTSL